MKLKLSDEDRERLGAPEWLDCSTQPLPVREAEALEDATGISAAEALEAMAPKVRIVDDGKTARFSYSAKGTKLRVWLGLNRIGLAPAYDELDFDAGRFLISQEQLAPEGKESGSPTDEPPTPSRSRSTGRTRSRKSPTST